MTTFSEAAAKDPLVVLAKTAAPAPVTWTEATGVQQVAGLKVRQWLAWPCEPTPWSRKCETQPWRAWALWTGLYGLGVAEGDHGLVEVEPVGRDGVLAIVGGVRLVTGKPENEATDVRVAIGGVGHGRLITPGLRLEDAFTAGGGAGALLQLELARALGWLAADEQLGLVALCGPLSKQVYGGPTQYRRDAGYLDGGYGLTESGWWRLAYESRQGVGRQERTRASFLKKMSAYRSGRDPRGGRRMHVRHTQALVLKLRRQEELVPLGVEYSALGWYFARELGMRADALMVSPDGGKLVWVEYLTQKECRRPPSPGGKLQWLWELPAVDQWNPYCRRHRPGCRRHRSGSAPGRSPEPRTNVAAAGPDCWPGPGCGGSDVECGRLPSTSVAAGARLVRSRVATRVIRWSRKES